MIQKGNRQAYESSKEIDSKPWKERQQHRWEIQHGNRDFF